MAQPDAPGRHGSASADDFLDLLGAGVVRDLRLATLVMIALTAMFGAMAPARISYATASAITDHPVLPWAREVVRPIANATVTAYQAAQPFQRMAALWSTNCGLPMAPR